MERYGDRLADLTRWLLREGICSPELLLASDALTIDRVMTAYVLSLYHEDRPYSHGSYAVAGVQLLRQDCRGQLRGTWRVLRVWQRSEPTAMRTPMPVNVLFALSLCFLLQRQPATALMFLIGFDALLRPDEMCRLQRRHLVLPRDGQLVAKAVLALTHTKTSNRGAKVQSVLIEDAVLVRLLDVAFGDLPWNATLLPGGYPCLRQRFAVALRLLRVPAGRYSLGSLRAGGATRYFELTGRLDELQYRGRWDSATSMRHYVQSGAAALAFARLPDEVADRVRRLHLLAVEVWSGVAAGDLTWTSFASQS